jgi:hypothetical protein
MTENFPYSNEQIAEGFNCTQGNIREHKSKHKDSLIKNIDYVSLADSNYKIFWSKAGVIKLADYIGTKEAKLFISQWIEKTIEKPFKEIQPENQIATQTEKSNLDNLPDSQLFGLMEMMLTGMKRQAEKISQLETRVEEVSNQKAMLNVIEVKTAKELLTIQKSKADDIGKEINALVFNFFVEDKENLGHRTQAEITEIYKQAHREARKLYYELEGKTYLGAKHSSFESKKEFLEWLKQVKV